MKSRPIEIFENLLDPKKTIDLYNFSRIDLYSNLESVESIYSIKGWTE
jgi:hypothetical protein